MSTLEKYHLVSKKFSSFWGKHVYPEEMLPPVKKHVYTKETLCTFRKCCSRWGNHLSWNIAHCEETLSTLRKLSIEETLPTIKNCSGRENAFSLSKLSSLRKFFPLWRNVDYLEETLSTWNSASLEETLLALEKCIPEFPLFQTQDPFCIQQSLLDDGEPPSLLPAPSSP